MRKIAIEWRDGQTSGSVEILNGTGGPMSIIKGTGTVDDHSFMFESKGFARLLVDIPSVASATVPARLLSRSAPRTGRLASFSAM